MDVLLLSSDLVVTSLVSSSARSAKVRLQVFPTPAALLAEVGRHQSAGVILDLAAGALDIHSLVASLRELDGPPRHIVAFGPHVHEQRLDAARQAGCDRVMSRGQFQLGIDEVIKTFIESPAKSAGSSEAG